MIRVASDRPYGSAWTGPAIASDDLYDRLAPFYDLGTSAFEDDLGLYAGLARRSGGPLLELGCGSGRLLFPLACEGFEVVGMDRSAAMLELARHRLTEGDGLKVALVQGDMTRPPLRGRFGLIFVALDGFLHLPTTAAQLATLRACRDLLASRGLLVLDLPGPAAPGWEDWSPGARPIVQAWIAPFPDGGRLGKFSSLEADASRQIHRVTELYERTEVDGAVRRWVVEYELRFVFPVELELLLAAARLQLYGRYGDYDLGPFVAGSPRQICVAGVARRRGAL